jgi:hypothetical protein
MANPALVFVSLDGGLTYQDATAKGVIVQHINVANSTDEVDPVLQYHHSTEYVTLDVATKDGTVIGGDKQDLDFIFCENVRD